MTYGIILGGNSSCTVKLFRIQKNVIRIMMGPKKRDSFKEMEILPLYPQYIYSLMLHTVNNIHLFTRNTEAHNIDTRQNINIFLPSTSFTKAQKESHYSGIKIYNHLPRELKQLSSDQKSFQFALKKFLYANPFYSLKEYFNYKCNHILESWPFYHGYDSNVHFLLSFICKQTILTEWLPLVGEI
jgi:hypothetical protein